MSCYIDVEAWKSGHRKSLDEQARLLKRDLSAEALRDFEGALNRVEAFVASGPGTPDERCSSVCPQRRAALLPASPVSSAVAQLDSGGLHPSIYHLIELKNTYFRYVVTLATEKKGHIFGVHLGSIVEDTWKALRELRQRDGRQWTKEHHKNQRLARINQFVNEQVRILDHVLMAGEYDHWILAGTPRVTSRISNVLPGHLAAKLIGIVPASEYERLQDLVASTLACFVERKEQESLARVDELLREINRHGLAAVGTCASLDALMNGQVDVLVLAKAYRPDPGWACDACGAVEVGTVAPYACPKCRERRLRERDLKEEMVRLAEQAGSEVKTVHHSDALMRLGGVGCLLRFLRPESYCTKAA